MEENETSWISDIAHQWPSLAWLVPVLFVAYYGLRFIALTHEPVGKLFGSVGKHWREAADKKQKAAAGEMGLLRDEVRSLSEKIGDLQLRDDLNWAFIRMDQDWHRRYELRAATEGWTTMKHMTFLEFRKKWLRDHGVEDKDEDSWE